MRATVPRKSNAENYNAFKSYNYPCLGHSAIDIKIKPERIRRPDPSRPLKAHYLFDTNVVVLTLFPGIQESIILQSSTSKD